MAEEKKPDPAPAQTGAPDPDEDDLDELDDVLDQFDATKISKDSPAAAAPPKPSGGEQSTPKPDSSKQAADPKPADLPDDADFAKQLEVGMAEMLKELESNPDMAKQFEDMMRQFGPPPGTDMPALGEEAAKATSLPEPSGTQASAPKDAAQGAPEPNFQDTIRRTMERMRASNASASAATADKGNPSEDDIMSALLQEIANSAPGEGGDDAFSSMLLGMMEQLTNKEILYEPMKELNDKYPAWLEERMEGKPKADTISAEDRKRYMEQQGYVKEIVARFEKPDYKDSNADDREYIVERMQKMQAAGAPPQDLVGDMGAASEMLGDVENGCPQQ